MIHLWLPSNAKTDARRAQTSRTADNVPASVSFIGYAAWGLVIGVLTIIAVGWPQ